VPTDAAKIGVFLGNGTGVATEVYHSSTLSNVLSPISDIGYPQGVASALTQAADAHTGANLISAGITFMAAPSEDDITNYRLYAGNAATAKGQLV